VGHGPDTPLTDEEIMPSDMRRLARYARYRASAKGRARTERYNNGPAGQVANSRAYMKRLRARIADVPQRVETLLATFEAAGASEEEIAMHRANLAPILARIPTKAR
jgi:hypothetical protein